MWSNRSSSGALGGEVLGGEALGGEVLGGEALGGEALGGEALGGEALGGTEGVSGGEMPTTGLWVTVEEGQTVDDLLSAAC